MRIKTLSIKGFRSFSDWCSVDFSALDNGLYLVTGENHIEEELGANGVGKSSLFEALTFALFGKTSTNLRAGDIINKNIPSQCEAFLAIEVNNESHNIIRTLHPNSLTVDGTVYSQERLEKLINLNFESFCYSVLISQFGQKFIDFDPSEKLEVFTFVLDSFLSKWDTFSDRAKKLSEATNENISLVQNDIINLNARKDALVVSYDDKIAEWNKDRDLRLEMLSNKISTVSQEIQDNGKLSFAIDADLLATQSYIDIAEKKFEEMSLEMNRLNKELEGFRDEIVRTRVMQLSNESKERALSSIESECPVCTQEVSEEIKQDLLYGLENDIEKNHRTLNFLLGKEDYLRKHVSDLEQSLLSTKVDIKKLEKQKNLDFNELTKIEEKKIANNDKLVVLQNSYTELQNSTSPYESILEDNAENLKVVEELLNTNNYNLKIYQEQFDTYKYWIKGFKEIKLMLIKEALVEFESIINNYLNRLGMVEWSVLLDIVSENKSGTIKKGFSLKVKSPTIKEFIPFKAYSGGESQRIRLATTLGLVEFIKHRRGSFTDILVLDEPTQFLSEEGISDLITCLKDLTNTSYLKIFLIDHRNLETFGIFSNIMTVIKDMDGSRVLWQK